MSKFTREDIQEIAKGLSAALSEQLPSQTHGVYLIPRKIEHYDYYELRDSVFEWFTRHCVTISEAIQVLEALESDVMLQECVGFKRAGV
jgi:hypothetical protein